MNHSDRALPVPSQHSLPADAPRGLIYSPLLAFVSVFMTFFTLAVGIHAPGFFSPMIYDSHEWIFGRADVFERGGLLSVMGMVPARPLFMASLYLNYAIGGMEPWSFRLFSALILAATGCVLAWTILWLLEIPRLSMPGTYWEKRVVAVGLALIFVAHPLQTWAVLYIWQREAIMSCFFYFSCVALYCRARSGPWPPPVLAYVSVSALFFLGLLTKENLATLPATLVAAEFLLFREGTSRTVRTMSLIALLTVPAFALYLLVTLHLQAPNTADMWHVVDRLAKGYQGSGLTLFQVILTESRVFFSYVMMVFVPFWHPMQLLQPQIVSVTLGDPPATVPAVLAIFGLMGMAVLLFKKSPLITFGILFALIAVAPESLLIPQYLFFGNRAILPMGGIMIAVAAVALHVLDWARQKSAARICRPVLAVALAVAVVGLASLTVSQARRWRPLEFWRAAYAHVPRSEVRVETAASRVIPVNLGAVLIDAGEYAEAAKVLREACRLDPEQLTTRLNLGLALCKSGASAEGIETLRTLVTEKPLFVPAWMVLADVLLQRNQAEEGIACLKKAIEHNPEIVPLRLGLASALVDAGNLAEGVQFLNEMAEKYPADPRVRVQMGLAMTKAHNWPEAIKQFSLAMEMDPGSLPAMQGLVSAQRQMRDVEQTLAKHRTEVQAHPESAEAHYRLADVLLKIGNAEEAIEHLQKALELEPKMDRARIVLGMALLTAGRNAEAIQTLTQAVAVIHGNAQLHYALGLALKREGRVREAIQQLKEALSIDPDQPDIREILRNLEDQAGSPETSNRQ